MTTSPMPPVDDPGEQVERPVRIRQLVQQFLRLPGGEGAWNDDQLLAAFASLRPELDRALTCARMIQVASAEAAMDEFCSPVKDPLASEFVERGGPAPPGPPQAAGAPRPPGPTPRAAATQAAPRLPRPAEERDVRVTLVEPDFDPRRTMVVTPLGLAEGAAEPPAAPPAEPGGLTPTQPFQPRHRAGRALLLVLDDGERLTGQWHRIRRACFSLGREVGDCQIADEVLMSDPHAQIVRRLERGRYVWHLQDLGSEHGTWARFSNMRLRDGDEVRLGQSRLRFQMRSQQSSSAAAARALPDGTWSAAVPLLTSEYWLGRDRRVCGDWTLDDPEVDPKQALLYLDAEHRWCLKDTRSTNGTWVRVRRALPLVSGCFFQLGEQRFRLFF